MALEMTDADHPREAQGESLGDAKKFSLTDLKIGTKIGIDRGVILYFLVVVSAVAYFGLNEAVDNFLAEVRAS